MKRFTIFAVMVLAMFALVLVGCGGKQDAKAPKADAPKAEAPKAPAADAKAPAADAKAPAADAKAPAAEKKDDKQLKGLFQH
jgi:ribosomal protein L12E/L44/L45/RPP1/RPP2